jgi:hypothetical protein
MKSWTFPKFPRWAHPMIGRGTLRPYVASAIAMSLAAVGWTNVTEHGAAAGANGVAVAPLAVGRGISFEYAMVIAACASAVAVGAGKVMDIFFDK